MLTKTIPLELSSCCTWHANCLICATRILYLSDIADSSSTELSANPRRSRKVASSLTILDRALPFGESSWVMLCTHSLRHSIARSQPRTSQTSTILSICIICSPAITALVLVLSPWQLSFSRLTAPLKLDENKGNPANRCDLCASSKYEVFKYWICSWIILRRTTWRVFISGTVQYNVYGLFTFSARSFDSMGVETSQLRLSSNSLSWSVVLSTVTPPAGDAVKPRTIGLNLFGVTW